MNCFKYIEYEPPELILFQPGVGVWGGEATFHKTFAQSMYVEIYL